LGEIIKRGREKGGKGERKGNKEERKREKGS
jgi:hypothetical protein